MNIKIFDLEIVMDKDAAENYEIDVAFIDISKNGHLAFNDQVSSMLTLTIPKSHNNNNFFLDRESSSLLDLHDYE